MRAQTHKLTIRLPKALVQRAKLRAIRQGTTVTAMVEKALSGADGYRMAQAEKLLRDAGYVDDGNGGWVRAGHPEVSESGDL